MLNISNGHYNSGQTVQFLELGNSEVQIAYDKEALGELELLIEMFCNTGIDHMQKVLSELYKIAEQEEQSQQRS